jgi:hypothetical protein
MVGAIETHYKRKQHFLQHIGAGRWSTQQSAVPLLIPTRSRHVGGDVAATRRCGSAARQFANGIFWTSDVTGLDFGIKAYFLI